MNKVILIGNLVADPELRKTQSNISVCTFRIAVQRDFKNAAGEREADFVSIVTWRGLADLCKRVLSKGNKVGLVGKLQSRSYDDKDGTKHYITEVIAEDMDFLTPRNAGTANIAASANENAGQTENATFTEVDDSELPF